MESPQHERHVIENYLVSAHGGGGLTVEHLEKLASEHVMGWEYDVWDAHTDEGRWWVITNPTNLYSQDDIRSMDVALSFHIGLMQRAMAIQPLPNTESVEDWVLDVLRRLALANEHLERAREVDDFQAVGARLRETLIALAAGLRMVLQDEDLGEEEIKAANFKGWAKAASKVIAVKSSRGQPQSLLESSSKAAWDYVAWLVHYSNASPSEARSACIAVGQVVELFLTAISRWRAGEPPRCRTCGSNQIELGPSDADLLRVSCKVCQSVEERPTPREIKIAPPADNSTVEAATSADDVDGECIFIEDFSLYVTPSEARAKIDEMAEYMAANYWVSWANGFTVEQSTGELADAHRLILDESEFSVATGAELVYDCDSELCVNPAHASDKELPQDQNWGPGIIRSATPRDGLVELAVERTGQPLDRIYVDLNLIERLGIGDVSSLLERIVMVANPRSDGWTDLVVGEQRSSVRHQTIQTGWQHPREQVDASAMCPCGSEETYGSCHGTEPSLKAL